jgi:drug/metabolite transporter (DMT)-like permease
LFLFVAGARKIPAAESALIGTLELVLSPLWVWLLFQEQPTPPTFLGGALILVVVLWHTGRDWIAAAP